MFKISIKKLEVLTKIGVSPRERKKNQPLLISMEFSYSVRHDKNFDDINNLPSYSEIIVFLKKYIQSSRFKTLEQLAVESIKKMKKKYKIKNISIEIEKPKVAKQYKAKSISVSK